MRRLLAILLVLMSAVGAALAAPARDADIRLVLLIAVDQFRYDYLTRFRSEFHEGLDRLLTQGAVFTDASLEHYPTVTAIGHSTMLTGATPSVSGIIGNDWFDRESGQTVTSVSDPGVRLLGADDAAQAASPHRLLVSTVGDEIKLASGVGRGAAEGPRVIGISLKDRSAILPAGHAADAAYWWDQKSGHFVTSTFYRSALPEWVSAFNAQGVADKFAGKSWSLLAPPSTELRRMPNEPGQPLYSAVYGSPFGNELLLGFATAALEHERLGQRAVTDLLTVSFSSNDSVGHTYGPDSPQLKDITIRTDRFIGALLDRVDKLVGLDHAVVALTADHGVAPMPEVLRDHGLPGGRMSNKDVFDPIEQALVQRFGEGKWILATAGSSPYFDYDLMARLKADPEEVRRVAAEAAAKVPHVARVYTRDQLMRGEVYADRVGRRILNGFNQERSGDLEIVLEPYWLRQAEGATHGTPFNYDAHIPLILMGPQVQPGEYDEHVALNDLAPTLATLVRVEIPAGSSGRVLTEALRPAPRPAATSTR
jgi:predicted AlkP superfamily pyrophosphatase or phosphodiesterase